MYVSLRIVWFLFNAGFQINALKSASDWRIFNWLRLSLRVPSSQHQIENLSESIGPFCLILFDVLA